ncbi:MAG: hypothetical protein CVT48_05790 [Thermoplasmata archaeon HGW-Thermoplasmata-1]|nr:MAG: hypothetical protein CVT48_05790 [Thermoplasmata archaeon HGW-Thermoplasmata-1]
MDVLVVGAGALGCWLSASLCASANVTVFCRAAQADAINENGILVVDGDGRSIYRSVKALDSADGLKAGFDLIIFAVKSYDTKNAAMKIKDTVLKTGGARGRDEPVVLSLQNGIGNEEKLAKVFGKENVLGGVTSHGMTSLGNGEIEHRGEGYTIIGEMDGSCGARCKRVAKLFSGAGIKTEVSENIVGEIWLKGIVNSAINPSTVIYDCLNGELLDGDEREKMMEDITAECVAVANAAGILLPHPNPIEVVKRVATQTAKNRSSMLQSIDAKKRTEIDSMNDYFVKLGRGHGIATPVNEKIVAKIKETEKERSV